MGLAQPLALGHTILPPTTAKGKLATINTGGLFPLPQNPSTSFTYFLQCYLYCSILCPLLQEDTLNTGAGARYRKPRV